MMDKVRLTGTPLDKQAKDWKLSGNSMEQPWGGSILATDMDGKYEQPIHDENTKPQGMEQLLQDGEEQLHPKACAHEC